METKEVSLKKMKRGATGLLLLMVFVYIAAKHGEQTYVWLGYIRAFAEAAMVGAFADWFAVTALFRHPFGVRWLRPEILRFGCNPEGLKSFQGKLGAFL